MPGSCGQGPRGRGVNDAMDAMDAMDAVKVQVPGIAQGQDVVHAPGYHRRPTCWFLR